MQQLGRPRLTKDQKCELWVRRNHGESACDIGRALQKHPASVFGVLRYHGGYPPRPRKRATRSLSPAEREEISRGLAAGDSVAA